ncbi:glycoside hydrolase family 3 N-terminal domain-containing protein [Terrarubrum flagellatum]|uniref:glycoside hydrolase family 3 N-terminal domain-containing protein n=1 Tax=Terrirubrum flagellatum TaxID=2895980 RepID=UPI0031452816
MSRRTLLASTAGFAGAAFTPAWMPAGTSPPASARVNALLERMTVEEKIGQLTLYSDMIRPSPLMINPDIDVTKSEAEQARFQLAEIRAGRVGGLLSGVGAREGRQLQKVALESRLKIPLIFGADVLHGFRTIFPIPLGLAASFDPALAERTARVAAIEMTSVGVHWTYAPMVDVARDQRWGRVAEGSGEDVYLTSQFAAAYVRGFQGPDLSAPDAALATPKHFAGYGAVLGGMDYNAVEISERELRETFLPPFKAAFDAGALTTMSAFTEIDGVPATSNHRLLTSILRREWGFKGFVVSDAFSAEELVRHGVAADEADAARQALLAGLDINLGRGLYRRELPAMVATDKALMAALDDAARRVLRVKEAIGLFDDPYRSLDPDREARDVRNPEHLALAREAARKSIVLLKNEGGLLPLPKSGKRIALIGPLADDFANLDGPWSLWARAGESVTLAAGLRAALEDPALLAVAKGSEIDTEIKGGVDEAMAAARAADVVVLALGEAQAMSGEDASRAEIVVPQAQQRLARAIAALGKPMIVVLSTGRALALSGAIRNADAILVGWFLGSEGGRALADIVFGDESPSGRLPVSFPQTSGQQPYFYNHKTTGRFPESGQDAAFTTRYRDVANRPLYPFGFGLTYSNVRYSATRASKPQFKWDDAITISARIENTGDRAVEEVAQLYIRDRAASVTRPIRQLKRFRRIALKPGESVDVAFTLDQRDLAFVSPHLKWIVEPSDFFVWIAPSALAGEPATFTLLAPEKAAAGDS